MATIALEDLTAEAAKLLDSLGEGSMSPCAYDTAWVARLRQPDNPDEPLFPASFDWLLRNQHADGSWGAEIPFAHDRVICTMSALVALAAAGPHRHDEAQLAVRRGVLYLNRERPNLRDDPAETVGFELILPELVRQAQALGLRLPYKDWEFIEAIKADKLRRIPPIAIYGGPTTLTHSLEYLGDRLAPMLVQRCQSPNGSYGASPSATAYVEMQRYDADAATFLQDLAASHADGGIPFFWPFTMYDFAWVLRELLPVRSHLEDYPDAVKLLASFWTPQGMHDAQAGTIPDLDTTAMAAIVLFQQHEMEVDFAGFDLFEADDHFYCYAFERNPSVTANAHLLEALRLQPDTPERRRMLLKAVSYLKGAREGKPYWQDKWHASPFYATAQAVRALAGIAPEAVRSATGWVLSQQHEDGTWGVTDRTPEETALALDTLIVSSLADPAFREASLGALELGIAYLTDHLHDPPTPLWVGKGLYAPHVMVHAIKLGSLFRADALLQ